MKIFKYLVLLILPGFLFVQCAEDDNLVDAYIYNFTTSFSVDHESDTMNIGDTIWISSEIKGFLQDSATGDYVYFSDALLNLNLMIRSWSENNYGYQPDNYKLVIKTQVNYLSHLNEATMVGLEYDFLSNEFKFEIGVVFNKAGIYSIDSDFLIYQLAGSSTVETYGGGTARLLDLSGNIKEGFLKALLDDNNSNLELYNELSENEKGKFQPVNGANSDKYFFINVIN